MEKKKLTQEELVSLAAEHKAWLDSSGSEGRQACLAGANLRDCDFKGTDFSRAEIRDCDLSGMMIAGAVFDACDFTGSNFEGSSLEDVSMQGCDFTKANMHRLNQCSPGDRKVKLNRAVFRDADLSQWFSHSFELEQADFSGANMKEARLLYGALAGANFKGSCLEDADFRFAKLAEADFSEADLTNAFLAGAERDSAVFAGSKIDGMKTEF